jgi:hypothetical protein
VVVTAADKDLNSPIGCPSRRRVKSPRTESGTRMPLPVSGPTSATHQRASLGFQGTLGAQAAVGDDGINVHGTGCGTVALCGRS